MERKNDVVDEIDSIVDDWNLAVKRGADEENKALSDLIFAVDAFDTALGVATEARQRYGRAIGSNTAVQDAEKWVADLLNKEFSKMGKRDRPVHKIENLRKQIINQREEVDDLRDEIKRLNEALEQSLTRQKELENEKKGRPKVG